MSGNHWDYEGQHARKAVHQVYPGGIWQKQSGEKNSKSSDRSPHLSRKKEGALFKVLSITCMLCIMS